MGFLDSFASHAKKKIQEGMDRARQLSDEEILRRVRYMREHPEYETNGFDECVKAVASERGLY